MLKATIRGPLAALLLSGLCPCSAARLELRGKPLQPRLLLLLRLLHLRRLAGVEARRAVSARVPGTSNTAPTTRPSHLKTPHTYTQRHTNFLLALTLKLVQPSHLAASSWRPPNQRPAMRRTHASAASTDPNLTLITPSGCPANTRSCGQAGGVGRRGR